jgi:hypothetical protein
MLLEIGYGRPSLRFRTAAAATCYILGSQQCGIRIGALSGEDGVGRADKPCARDGVVLRGRRTDVGHVQLPRVVVARSRATSARLANSPEHHIVAKSDVRAVVDDKPLQSKAAPVTFPRRDGPEARDWTGEVVFAPLRDRLRGFAGRARRAIFSTFPM